MISSELTVVARAGSAVIRGVTSKASGSPEWPNFHAALMELHEILDEWLNACKMTTDLILGARGMEPARIKEVYTRANVSMPFFYLLGDGFSERAEKDIAHVMNPPTPAWQQWSRSKRRQAARKTLRGMKKIYCPELLNAFDSAVRGRSNWVRANRKLIKESLKGEPPQFKMTRLLSDSIQTVTNLEHLKAVIAAVILEKYPLGGTATPN